MNSYFYFLLLFIVKNTGFLLKIKAMILILLSFNLAHAKAKLDVLIINSDASVTKYSEAETAFLSQSNLNIQSINAANFLASQIPGMLRNYQADYYYCIGTKAYLHAHRFLQGQTVVFSSVMNWKRLPVISNSLGIAQEVPIETQLLMYRYLFPEIKKLGILYSTQLNQEFIAEAKRLAKDVSIEIISARLRSEEDLAFSLNHLLDRVDALWLIADPVVLKNEVAVNKIFKKSYLKRVPVFSYNELFIDLGAILVISEDIPTISLQVNSLIEQMISSSPGYSVKSPAGSHIILNKKNLEYYSIKLNKAALNSVNKIIE